MKKLIIIIVFCFSIVWAEDEASTRKMLTEIRAITLEDTTLMTNPTIRTDPSQIENKEEVIKYFIESGDVCKVIGHVWEVYDPCVTVWNEHLNYGYNVIPCLGTKTRTCKICGLKQKETSKTEKIEVEREVKEWVNVD